MNIDIAEQIRQEFVKATATKTDPKPGLHRLLRGFEKTPQYDEALQTANEFLAIYEELSDDRKITPVPVPVIKHKTEPRDVVKLVTDVPAQRVG